MFFLDQLAPLFFPILKLLSQIVSLPLDLLAPFESKIPHFLTVTFMVLYSTFYVVLGCVTVWFIQKSTVTWLRNRKEPQGDQEDSIDFYSFSNPAFKKGLLSIVVAMITIMVVSLTALYMLLPFGFITLLSITYFLLMGLGILAVPFWLYVVLWRKLKPKTHVMGLKKMWIALGIFGLLSVMTIWKVETERWNILQAEAFFGLHAAVKNTCLVDTTKSQCPKNIEELSYIAPNELAEAQKKATVFYQYDESNNQYSLVVRYSPVQAVVFDQRFLSTDGLDFKEYTVSTFGKDSLVNPPFYLGPWQFPEWKSN